ncbi:4Fe-4S binding protein [Opitutus terrae]|uniref:4Fe-4S ferredoxin iron-sulfur binding domain protein n=1 Tax=Opitutus terrae (strain DSM 11246 / JCM 15787 / PB90-1) TaxID=452637 RepID=B1ZUV9_OPITP|nr:4Fe-4S binding protein [Opitutus terrae]ACB75929.1 4Fe-4S ferredoxin iron-sulfur binding domain protein [Opitutus terrae PB90-1]
MARSRLKLLRVAAGALVFAACLVVFLDPRGSLPTWLGYSVASTQFVPALLGFATGAAFATALALLLALTLAFGRVYCSVICPLGILQDLIARARDALRRKRLRLPYRPAAIWARRSFFSATLLGIVTGWFGFALSLFDPYSIFGRIASDLFRPVVVHANNLLAQAANAAGLTLVARIEPQWAAAGALAFPLLGLAIVTVMAVTRGRLYCNTVCPVGTFLGFLSRRSAFRLSIDSTVCRKCGDCLRVCKAQCIDLRTATIDASRCVACYNCVGACDEHGIRHRFSWRRGAASQPPARASATRAQSLGAADPQRRTFLAALSVASAAPLLGAGRGEDDADEGAGRHRHRTRKSNNESRAIAPPGAESVDRLLEHCTACHLCISACPTHVLQPAFLDYGWNGLMKPRLDYSRAYCLFDCQRCSEVCPDGALTPLTLAQKHAAKIGVAKLDVEKCIVKTKGTDCAACSEHCPTKAVDTKPYGDNLRLPWVHGESCIGCGACEFACPADPKAIRVTGHQRHGFVRERPVEKATAPVQTGDFPF